jgi:hypothetical protein
MFEIGIISIIVLAVGYWVTLWLMGRHDDVLHGDFVHAEEGAEAAALSDPAFPARPLFPPKPVIKPANVQPVKPLAVTPATAKPATAKPAIAKPAALKPTPTTEDLPAQPAPAPAAFSERSDTLQSLLASIKRDLKDASQL